PAVTRPIDLMPPTSTSKTSAVRINPVTQMGTLQLPSTFEAIALPWVIFPMPKQAMTEKIANANAKMLPTGPRIPRARYYRGQPVFSPAVSVPRNRTPKTASAYLDAMPTRPVTHIQNKAPGPPIPMAVATPTILPVPTVAASAVVNAWNWEISPLDPGSFRLIMPKARAGISFVNCNPPKRMVR